MSEGKNKAAALWAKVCNYVKTCYSGEYETALQWFQGMVPLNLTEGELTLGVNDEFFATWITDNYGELIRESLRACGGADDLALKFEYGYLPDDAKKSDDDIEVENEASEAGRNDFIDGVDPDQPGKNSVPDDEQCKNLKEQLAFVNGQTFNNFVVGEENRYAFTAASTAAKKPGTFNPVYIYGGSGMGKTHLLKAVTYDVLTSTPKAIVRYTTCEEFLNEFVDSLRSHTNNEFRARFRNVDYLLVDDVHHLAGKTQLQEEFFNTFNALHSANKQIILTSDKQPSEIQGLEERLVSRFLSGITTQITQPTFETRLAILKQEQMSQKLKLSDDVLNFIAKSIVSNIRPLKGALLRLSMIATALGRPIDLETAQSELADLLDKEAETRTVTIEAIQKVVTDYFGLHVSDITGPKRPKNIAEARMIAMYLARKMTTHTHQEIGLAFGGRNHATVVHAVQHVEDMSLKNEDLKAQLKQFQRQLRSV